jgi:hypothetical protein
MNIGATILDKLERIPPFVCRLIARTPNGRHGLSHRDIMVRSGLERSTVRQLSFATTWRGREIDSAVAFALACGVNHLAAEKQIDFLKRRKWTHVERAIGGQANMYRRLKLLLVEEAKRKKSNRPST